jgi:cytochrome c553
MGNDPSTTVVNRYCQSWDIPNVFVVGSSNHPQKSTYNPTGVLGALIYWTADALKTRYLKFVAQYYAAVRATSFAARPPSPEVIAGGEQLAKVGALSIRVQACESYHGPNGMGLLPTVPYLAGSVPVIHRPANSMYRKGFRKNQVR